MIVTLKTLQDDVFTVEIDPSDTVMDFKERIEEKKGKDFPAKSMKLMYAGKFLVDNKKISDYNVEEKKFVIVVVKKAKCSVVKMEPRSDDDEPGTAQTTSSEAPQDPQEPEAPQAPQAPQARSNFTNAQRRLTDEELIQEITELGFTRAQVLAAMRICFNNPDGAVEYLLNGVIPSSFFEDAEREARRRNPDNISDSQAAQLLREISQPNLPSHENLMQLFSNAVEESENQLRAADSMMEEDRDLITRTFAEMEAAEILAGRASGATTSSSLFAPGVLPRSHYFTSDSMTFDSHSNDFYNSPALNFAGNLLDRDHEAIERLKQLGFSDRKAIEAYFVCERNENAAADYLFSSQNFE